MFSTSNKMPYMHIKSCYNFNIIFIKLPTYSSMQTSFLAITFHMDLSPNARQKHIINAKTRLVVNYPLRNKYLLLLIYLQLLECKEDLQTKFYETKLNNTTTKKKI
jgi:hypothetical protein